LEACQHSAIDKNQTRKRHLQAVKTNFTYSSLALSKIAEAVLLQNTSKSNTSNTSKNRPAEKDTKILTTT
jgi:hypothetical protein